MLLGGNLGMDHLDHLEVPKNPITQQRLKQTTQKWFKSPWRKTLCVATQTIFSLDVKNQDTSVVTMAITSSTGAKDPRNYVYNLFTKLVEHPLMACLQALRQTSKLCSSLLLAWPSIRAGAGCVPDGPALALLHA